MEVSSVKKLIALPLAVVFALTTAGLALAQEKKPETMKSDTMKSDTKMEKKAEKKAPSKTANGTVKSASADSVVVAGKDKGKDAEWTFAVDPKTSIKKGGKAITAADIKTGDSVQVKYTEADGKAMAQSVTVKAPAAAAKKMDDKKTDAAAKPAAPAAEKK
jgi:ribosomal protein S1